MLVKVWMPAFVVLQVFVAKVWVALLKDSPLPTQSTVISMSILSQLGNCFGPNCNSEMVLHTW